MIFQYSDEQLIDDYIYHITNYEQLSKNTIESKLYDINKYQSFLQENKCSNWSVDISFVNKFVEFLSKEKKLSAKSVNRILSTCYLLYKYLYAKKIVSSNPFSNVYRLNQEKSLPDVLEIDQVEEIIFNDISKSKKYRDRLVIALMFYGGLRISEVSALTYDDISIVEEFMIVNGKNSKQRFVFINEKLMQILLEYIESDKGPKTFLIKNPQKNQMSRQSLWTIVKNKSKFIDKNVKPHTFRHSFASFLISKGLSQYEIKELLGHSSIQTSQIYTHINNKELESKVQSTFNDILEELNIYE